MRERVRFSATAKILEAISWIALAALLLIPTIWYGQLPEQIPTHYGFSGLPDHYSGKGALWMLPVIGVVMFLLFSGINLLLTARPSRYEKRKPEELSMLPKVILLMQLFKVFLTMTFAYIALQTIRVAHGEAEGLGAWFLTVFIGVILISPLVFLIRVFRKKA
jgi:uncharacterized membrane protein